MSAPFRASDFQKLMPNWQLVYSQQIDSTNAQARRTIVEGEAESGMLFLADSQSSGVGRRGNAWHSGANENLLFSAVLETELQPSSIGKLSLLMGLAVVDSLTKLTPAVSIKWPNDVYVDGKKIAGILCEHIDGFSIIGVGLNVFSTGFPKELNATSIVNEGVQMIERESLLAEILNKIAEYASVAETHFESFQQRLNQAHYLTDKKICFQEGGEQKVGIVREITKDASLAVQGDDGSMRNVYSASELRRIY